MTKILIFVSGFIPGYKSGGPVKTIANLIKILDDRYKFQVVCSDRDQDDSCPYPSVSNGVGFYRQNTQINYVAPGLNGYLDIFKILVKTDCTIVHLNSFFSFKFSIFPIFVLKCILRSKNVIVGPRGEFSVGALRQKKLKKLFYLFLARSIFLYKNVRWHCSTDYEVKEVINFFGDNAKTYVALDIGDPPSSAPMIKLPKSAGIFTICFVSRISRKKNLEYALNLINSLSIPVKFIVAGPIEDSDYWNECLILIENLPANVVFEYRGSLEPDQIPAFFCESHLFLFPTHGENYGHVIWEALISGTPVLISDMTPWDSVTKYELGAEIPLAQQELYLQYIYSIYNMSDSDYQQLQLHIHKVAKYTYSQQDALFQHLNLFE